MADAMNGAVSLSSLNAASAADFTKIVGPIFEHSLWIAETAAARRPFASLGELLETMKQIVGESGAAKQLALINAHPDLAGRLAQAGQLTAESTREQASAGLTTTDANTIAQIQSLNERYRTRFQFPFIICARLNNVSTILSAMENRLSNERETEIATALTEIGKIAELRLRDLCPEN